MPIGGSAYYDKFKKNSGPKSGPSLAPRRLQGPASSQVATVVLSNAPVAIKSKVLVKTVRPYGRTVKSAVRLGLNRKPATASMEDPTAVKEVVAQILDLAQRVNSVAAQAEAAVLRAQAAVLKAEIAVGKAEAAATRAEGSAGKCNSAVSSAEAAVFKAESSGKRAEMFAGKAGLSAGKSEMLGQGSSAGSPVLPLSNGGTSSFIKDASPQVSQIAVMSMKLRSGMRQIDEANEQIQDTPASFKQTSGFNTPVERDNLASGLVSLDSDTALPRVAPFIMDDVSYSPRAADEASSDSPKA